MIAPCYQLGAARGARIVYVPVPAHEAHRPRHRSEPHGAVGSRRALARRAAARGARARARSVRRGFAHGWSRAALAELLLRRPWLSRKLLTRAGPLTGFLLWMQLRTRALDDVLLDFVRQGGRQVVLLGAGFDCRALRFGAELASATRVRGRPPVHAGRQDQAAAGRGRAHACGLRGWDFERDPHGPAASSPARAGTRPQPARAHDLGRRHHVPVARVHRAHRARGARLVQRASPGSRSRTSTAARIGAPRGELRLTAAAGVARGRALAFRLGAGRPAVLVFGARLLAGLRRDATPSSPMRFLPARFWRHFSRKNRRLAVVHAARTALRRAV